MVTLRLPSFGVPAGAATVILVTLVCLPTVAAAQEAGADRLVQVAAFTMPFRELDVASEIGGVLTSVRVEEGDEVREGEVLAEFKSDVLQARLAVSKAQVESAESKIAARQNALDMAQGEYERYEGMFEENLITDQQFKKALFEKEGARLQLAVSQVEKRIVELVVAQVQAELNRTVVRAPMSGQVFRIAKRAGEAVELHSHILRMVSVDPLYVVGYAPINTAGRIKVGMKATVVLENVPDQPLECTVAVVDKVADAASGTYRVKLTLPNPDRSLMAGAKGELSFDLSPQAPASG